MAKEPEHVLSPLLTAIREKGVDEARRQSEKIIKKAEDKAAAITEKAQEEAQGLLSEAQKKIERDTQSFQTAMRQAGRDLLLTVRQNLLDLCGKIAKEKVSGALTPEFLQNLIREMAKTIGPDEKNPVEFVVGETDAEALSQGLLGELSGEMQKGVNLTSSPNKKGLSIKFSGSDRVHELTEEGITEALLEHASGKITRFLQDGTVGHDEKS